MWTTPVESMSQASKHSAQGVAAEGGQKNSVVHAVSPYSLLQQKGITKTVSIHPQRVRRPNKSPFLKENHGEQREWRKFFPNKHPHLEGWKFHCLDFFSGFIVLFGTSLWNCSDIFPPWGLTNFISLTYLASLLHWFLPIVPHSMTSLDSNPDPVQPGAAQRQRHQYDPSNG